MNQEKNWKFGIQRTDKDELCKVIYVNDILPPNDRKIAIEAISKSLENGCLNKDTGFLLKASKSDAKKTLFHKSLNSPIVLAIVDKIEDIAKESLHIESHADVQHENSHVQAIHILSCPIIVKNSLFRLELTVRDYWEGKNSRKMVHSIDGIEISQIKTSAWEHLAQEVTRTNSSARCKTSQPTGGHKDILSKTASIEQSYISFKSLISGYIRADGKDYFDPVSDKEFLRDGTYKSDVRDSFLVSFHFANFRKMFAQELKSLNTPLNQDNSEKLIRSLIQRYSELTESGNQLSTDENSFFLLFSKSNVKEINAPLNKFSDLSGTQKNNIEH